VKTVSIIGVGNAGGALALALARVGYTVETLIHKSPRIARKIKLREIARAKLAEWPKIDAVSSEILIIAVPDPSIGVVSHQLESLLGRGQIVLHTSGSLTSSELSNLTHLGCHTGSIHPLVSISDPFQGAEQFHRAYFCIEGDRRALGVARGLVKALNGKSFTIDQSKKALYHAAAVTSAGHVAALYDVAIEMLSNCGVTKRESAKMLFPLIQSVVHNLEQRSTEDALTGSFSRLDVAAFERHVASFRTLSNPVRQLYFALAERSLDIVERRDHSSRELADFRRRISVAKRNSK
jgi:predicted short-subunit dehydrogenase-like oxidoreductase (DUF2520 family)